MAIMAANIPAIRPLFGKIFGPIRGTRGATTRSAGRYGNAYNMSNAHSRPGGYATSQQGSKHVAIPSSREVYKPDSASDKSILPHLELDDAIRRTVTVELIHEDKQDRAQKEKEDGWTYYSP